MGSRGLEHKRNFGFPSQPQFDESASFQPGSLNCQFSQRISYQGNWSGDVRRGTSTCRSKFKESRRYIGNPQRMNALNGILGEARKIKNEKRPVSKKRNKSPCKKVRIEIFLEKLEAGVFVTKVKLGNRVKWQNVKNGKRALRYHPAIRKRQAVKSAIQAIKNYKTIIISLTKDEAVRYKAGDLLEGPGRKKPQINNYRELSLQVNNYQQNNYEYCPGPSTSSNGNNDNDEFSESDVDFSDDDEFSEYNADFYDNNDVYDM